MQLCSHVAAQECTTGKRITSAVSTYANLARPTATSCFQKTSTHVNAGESVYRDVLHMIWLIVCTTRIAFLGAPAAFVGFKMELKNYQQRSICILKRMPDRIDNACPRRQVLYV